MGELNPIDVTKLRSYKLGFAAGRASGPETKDTARTETGEPLVDEGWSNAPVQFIAVVLERQILEEAHRLSGLPLPPGAAREAESSYAQADQAWPGFERGPQVLAPQATEAEMRDWDRRQTESLVRIDRAVGIGLALGVVLSFAAWLLL